jgi:hypothetical protein
MDTASRHGGLGGSSGRRAGKFRRSLGRFATAGFVATSLLAFGCTAVVDLDRFREGQALSSASFQYRDLKLDLIGMKPHHTHFFEFRVIDVNNFVQCRGVVDQLTADDASFRVPKAVPRVNGPYRLDFWADVNASGNFDGLGSVISNDHAWRIQPLVDFPEGTFTPVEGVVQVAFVHSTTFTNIDLDPGGVRNPAKDTELPTKVAVSNVDAYLNRLFQIRVLEKATGHTVGLYRAPSLKKGAFEATIPGCVDIGVEYDVEVYIDANGNNTYDVPGPNGDKGWRFVATSTEAGLAVAFDPAVDGEGAVDVGPP